MEIWSEIRRGVLTGALSKRAAIAKYKVGWHTLKKMLAHDEPPGYRQAKQRPKPKLNAFLALLRQMLEDHGRFTLPCAALERCRAAELRLVACHTNDATTTRAFPYAVAEDGTLDVEAMQAGF